MPFGQVGHITNFSRDWTTVKFNLAFAHGTDIELLRKTVKKIGLDMMEEPAFKPILMQPLKMQGVVDIKDNSADRALQVHGAAEEPQHGPAHGGPPHVRGLPGARHPVRHADLPVRDAGDAGAPAAPPPPPPPPRRATAAPAKAAE